MSAFHVGDRHINTLLCIADQWGVTQIKDDHYLESLGHDLSKANDDSVNYRYNCNDKYPYKFKRVNVNNLTPIEVIKLCQCFDYQCCEIDSWDLSTERNFIQNLMSSATSKLPGYEDAPWCLDYLGRKKLQSSADKIHEFLDDAYQLLQSLTDAVGELQKYDGIEQDLESLQDHIDSASETVTTLAELID